MTIQQGKMNRKVSRLAPGQHFSPYTKIWQAVSRNEIARCRFGDYWLLNEYVIAIFQRFVRDGYWNGSLLLSNYWFYAFC